VVRLSAGREDMSEETQALCFLAGANSIFYGPKLLTTPNPARDRDMALLDKLGMRPMSKFWLCQRYHRRISVLENLNLFYGDQTARHHAVEHWQECVDLVLRIDNLYHDRQILR